MKLHLIIEPAGAGLLDDPLLRGRDYRLARLYPKDADAAEAGELSAPWTLLGLMAPWEESMQLVEALRRADPCLGIMVTGAGRGTDATVEAYRRGVDLYSNDQMLRAELMAAVHSFIRGQLDMRQQLDLARRSGWAAQRD